MSPLMHVVDAGPLDISWCELRCLRRRNCRRRLRRHYRRHCRRRHRHRRFHRRRPYHPRTAPRASRGTGRGCRHERGGSNRHEEPPSPALALVGQATTPMPQEVTPVNTKRNNNDTQTPLAAPPPLSPSHTIPATSPPFASSHYCGQMPLTPCTPLSQQKHANPCPARPYRQQLTTQDWPAPPRR